MLAAESAESEVRSLNLQAACLAPRGGSLTKSVQFNSTGDEFMHARPSKSYRLLRVLLPAITMVVLAAILVGVWFVPRLLRADQGPVQAQNPPSIPEVSIVAHDYAFSKCRIRFRRASCASG